jgi:hypothetical protein
VYLQLPSACVLTFDRGEVGVDFDLIAADFYRCNLPHMFWWFRRSLAKTRRVVIEDWIIWFCCVWLLKAPIQNQVFNAWIRA